MTGLSGAASRWAAGRSGCCHPRSHFHAPVRQSATMAIMKLTIWVWSSLMPGTWRATIPAIQAAATVNNGVASRTTRLMIEPSEIGSPVGAEVGVTVDAGVGNTDGIAVGESAGVGVAGVDMGNVDRKSTRL